MRSQTATIVCRFHVMTLNLAAWLELPVGLKDTADDSQASIRAKMVAGAIVDPPLPVLLVLTFISPLHGAFRT
jgi:hypothetical protein